MSATLDSSTASNMGIDFPTNVEFQVQIDVMVAILRPHDPHDPFSNRPLNAYVRSAGTPVHPPPLDFTYIPPGLDYASPRYTCGKYVGWTLRCVSVALQEANLPSNWPLYAYNGPIPEFDVQCQVNWTVSLGPPTLRETQEPEFEWVSVRILSPHFSRDSFIDNPIEQLELVSRVLNEKFITFADSNSRLTTLVRPLVSSGPLSYLKKIGSLLWVIDPLLSEIHPPHCGPGALPSLGLQFTRLAQQLSMIDTAVQSTSADILEDPWSYRLSANRKPLTVIKSPGKLTEPQFQHGLGMIRSAKTLEALLDLLTIVPVARSSHPLLAIEAPKGAAYDFTNLNKSVDSSRGMLAFNQHCGTLDFHAILHWTMLTTHLVALSASATLDFESLLQSLQYGIMADTLSLHQALYSNGLEETAAYYQRRQGGLHPPELELWPVLRNAICADHSEPTLEQDPRTLNHPGLLRNANGGSEDRARNLKLLGVIGESMERWHCPSRNHNPDSRYTVGIEIEMLAPYMDHNRYPEVPTPEDDLVDPSREVSEDPQPSDGRTVLPEIIQEKYLQLTETLEGFNVAASSTPWGGQRGISQRAEHRRQYIRSRKLLPNGFPLDYQVWMVQADSSINATRDWNGYDGISGIELVSPIFRDTPGSWEEILDAVSGLRRAVRLAVDGSCGLHVSVGAGDYDMSFAFLRKLAAASFLADRLIFSLCDPGRKMDGAYCSSLREESNLAYNVSDHWRNLPVLSDFEQHFPLDSLSEDECGMLKKIWVETKFLKLAELIRYNGGGRSSVSFNRVEARYPDEDLPKNFSGAVEFRHLQGTLDPELILRFSQLVVALFRFVDTAEPRAFQEFSSNLLKCRDIWDYDINILENFLAHLGMSADYPYWEDQVQKNRTMAPAIRETIERYEARSEEYYKSEDHLSLVKILPEVPEDIVETLRKDVCHRPKFASYAKKKLGDVTPQIIHADANADLLSRTLAISEAIDGVSKESLETLVSQVQIADLSKSSLRKRLDDLNESYRASEPLAMDPVTAEELIKIGVDCLERSDIDGLFAAVDRHGRNLVNPEAIEVSTKDLNSLIGVDGDGGDVPPFMWADFSRIEENPLQVSLTEEELRRLV